MALREDKIGFGDLVLTQDDAAFCYGIDAVLIANYLVRNMRFTPKTICDLGCGNGILPLILAHFFPKASIVGVELQREVAELATDNIKKNNLEDRCKIVNMDVKDVASPECGLTEEFQRSFDAVISNPPYIARGSGLTSRATSMAISRHESSADLWDFMAGAATLLKAGGEFYMVHRPNRLAEIFAAGRDFNMQPKQMRFVQPHIDSEANIVLIKMVKDGRLGLRMDPILVVRNKQNEFTDEIREIYRGK